MEWMCRSRSHDFEWKGPLVAVWEVYEDPISDDFLPEETSARKLLDLWRSKVEISHPDGLIPIYWFVRAPENAKFEAMPFQLHPAENDFLSYYTWPADAETGDRLNWNHLPVTDKRWQPGQADKGGFIQEATGWKPSILQPHVYLPSLLKAADLL